MQIHGRLRNHLGFRLGVSAVLALSVGLNVAVFALVNALWLRPLPVKDPERIVTVIGLSRGWFTPKDIEMFESLAGQVSTDLGFEPDLRLPGMRRALEPVGVTFAYFSLFGIDVRGRNVTEDDDRVGAEPVAIISDRLWAQEFDRRDDVIGTVVAAHPVHLRIIGVAPAGFDGARRGERTDVWIPRGVFNRVLRVPAERPLPPFTIWARLRPGDTVASVDQRIKEDNRSASVASLLEVYGTPTQGTVLIGQGGAAQIVAGLALLVLLGGCAAIAALVLVHYERRRPEFGVRAALGASRGRLVSMLTGELALIGLVGTLGSVVLANIATRWLPSLSLSLPGGVDLGRLDVSLDWRVLLAGLLMTAVTLGCSASLPIARMTRPRLAGDIVPGPATTASVASLRVRQGLLALLVCATVVVLVSAGLFIRAVERGFSQAAGFDVDRTIFATVPVAPPGLPLQVRSRDFSDSRTRLILDALREVRGVESVAIGSSPIGHSPARQIQTPMSVTAQGVEHRRRFGYLRGSPEMLSTLGVPIIAGRGLTPADVDAAPAPVVLTQSVARTLWPDRSPVGELFGSHYVVIGVARDFAFGTLSDPADGVWTVHQYQDFGEKPQFVLRTQQPNRAILEDVRRTLRTLLPDASSATVMSGREVIAADLGRQRLGAWFFSGFGLVALVVGVGSVFGLVSYLAESRRREFGIRLALGANSRNLVWQGVTVALVPSATGLVCGLFVSAALSQIFGSMLVGVSTMDPMTYGVVSVSLLCAAVTAALLAAWRLRRVRPAEVLKVS